MSKVCVCIEGQLRGSKRCGPTIKKNLIDKLNADLYFVVQNYERHNLQSYEMYGNAKKIVVYDNPEPNFENIFDNLCNYFNYDKNKWRETFEKIKDQNYKLGFDKPGTCIRRMYNRYLIYNELKDKDYEWYIVLRSDLYFINYFYNLNMLSQNKINVYNGCEWGGYNNNIIIFHKNIFENVLTYIKTFLNGDFLKYTLTQYVSADGLNEETFFKYNMNINNVYSNYIKNLWYISADDENETTTWAKITISSNGDIFKYHEEYYDAIKNNI